MVSSDQASPSSGAQAPPALPRLKRLVVHRFRNVRSGTELTFDDDWNLLLGKNGTGKTTLLRLLEALLTGELTNVDPWPLDAEYEIEIGAARLRSRIQWNCGVSQPGAGANDQRTELDRGRDLRAEGSLSIPEAPHMSWEYTSLAGDFRLRIGDAEEIRSMRGLLPAAFALAAPALSAASVHLTQGGNGAESAHMDALMSLQRVRRFDEALSLFSSLVGWSLTLYQGPGGKHATFDTPNGHEALGALPFLRLLDQALLERLRESKMMRWARQDHPILAAFEDRAGLGAVTLELPLKRFDIAGEERSFTLGPCRLCATRPDGAFFYDSDFSFGQRRLFAFLHAAQAPIVLADELSNGMHRDWLDGIVSDLRGRQTFVAAQNPLLLDRIGFQDEEQMRRSFVLCREEGGQFVWENARPEDVREVYRAYDVGLQNLSEILWQKGLW